MIASLDKEHIDFILKTQHIGRLGCAFEGQPYVVPITYVYEDGFIYGHTNDGQKMRMIRQNPKVCLEVDQIRDMTYWQSVIALGTFEELKGEEAVVALDLIFSRLASPTISESMTLPDSTVETVSQSIKLKSVKGVTYRIRISEISGRYERP